MGQTSECIQWGIDHGLDGEGAIPNFLNRLAAYSPPYMDGYKMGFLYRKVGVKSWPPTSQEDAAYDRLYHLCYWPRYKLR